MLDFGLISALLSYSSCPKDHYLVVSTGTEDPKGGMPSYIWMGYFHVVQRLRTSVSVGMTGIGQVDHTAHGRMSCKVSCALGSHRHTCLLTGRVKRISWADRIGADFRDLFQACRAMIALSIYGNRDGMLHWSWPGYLTQ